MQIEPRSYFTLFRGLENHLDSSTYYVQAVIRDGLTAALLDTVQLTDNGNREFSQQWQAPADPNGTGRYITVTYSVYTDSGYTTKSENYGDKYEEHEIRHRPDDVRMPSGGDVDYKKIQKMIDAAVAGIKFPTPEKVDLKPVLKAIKDIPKTEIPEQKEIDLSAVTQAFAFIRKDLSELLSRPSFEKVDLTPIIIDLQTIKEFLVNSDDDGRKQVILDALSKESGQVIKSIGELGDQVKPALDFIEALLKLFSKVQLQDKEPQKDFISLANEQARKGKE